MGRLIWDSDLGKICSGEVDSPVSVFAIAPVAGNGQGKLDQAMPLVSFYLANRQRNGLQFHKLKDECRGKAVRAALDYASQNEIQY